MLVANLLLIAFVVGHVLHMILLLNIAHGMGSNARWLDELVFGLLGLISLVVLAAVYGSWGRPVLEWSWPVKAYGIVCLGTLLIGLPAVTIARARRGTPSGVEHRATEFTDLVERHGLEAMTGPGGRSRLLRLPFNDAFRVKVSSWSLTIEDLPEAMDGLSILHLTDLHFAPTYNRRFFEEVIQLAIGQGPEPDLVAITGDFLDHDGSNAWVAPLLSRLRGRLGQFAILGNHDFRHDFRTLRRELRRAGFTTLEGRWSVLDVNGCRLAIGGTSYPWGKDLGRRPIPTAEARILLSHAPDQIYRASDWGVDLVLCGHNHGGQVRVPIFGPILMPSRYSRRFDRGFFRVGDTLMSVSQGVGAKDPVRVGCHPEVTRLTLRSPALRADRDRRDVNDSLASFAQS
jgi:predicted MPP superfamily phosphohydrolase